MTWPRSKLSFPVKVLSLASVICGAILSLFLTGCGASAGPFASTAAATVVTPAAGATNPVVTPLVVQGPSALLIGTRATYSVSTPLPAGTSITWSVTSSGSSTSIGMISSSGVYQAPSVVPSQFVLIVTASVSSPLYSNGMLQVTLAQPTPSITSATATTSVVGTSYLLDVQSTGLNLYPLLLVNGNPVPTTQVSLGDLQATLPTPAQSQITVQIENTGPDSTFSAVATIGFTSAVPSVTATTRLLDQSTFGPTETLITQVQQSGFSAFLDQQFATAPTLVPAFTGQTPNYCADLNSCIRYFWWGTALYGPDQLRQRVALALSEMWVVSSQEVSPYGMPQYLNVLSADAFSNWYTLMKDVTLTPAMGSYLNMVNSLKPANGAIANQNFAREMMQLFSIGTSSLYNDGTPILDSSGNTIPNYTQAQVDGFARAYTGWTYPSPGASASNGVNWVPTFNASMVPIEDFHDTAAKPLLSGVTLPAGQTAEQDLEGALQNLFQHPSLPPFVCKQLIQHLVTSNPSTDYVARVATVFVDNGQGVRGDMQAVTRAILLDPEARAGDDGYVNPNLGHLREPILWIAGALRGLSATPATSDLTTYTFADVSAISLGQEPQSSPSVFNFFTPSYQLPGTSSFAPEFQLEQTASALSRLNVGDAIVFSDWIGNFNIDFTGYWASLLTPDPNALMDELSRVFLHNQMSSQMRSSILNAISSVSDPVEQVRMAMYLVITSTQYKIIR